MSGRWMDWRPRMWSCPKGHDRGPFSKIINGFYDGHGLKPTVLVKKKQKKKKKTSVIFLQKVLYSCCFSFRKHTYSNILRILPPKNENLQMKNSDIFLISAQNIDCRYSLEPPRWGGSNEYPQFMFFSRNKKNNVYPCKPQFYNIKVGFMGVKII